MLTPIARRRCNIINALANPSVLFVFLLLLAVRAFASQATLAWTASADPTAVGYMLYYGQTSGNYTSKVDVGNQTGYTVSGLLEGNTYYYAATAYDASRTESAYSNEATSTVPYAQPSASFSTNTTSGAAPLTVTFTSTSTGTITGYSWNFGDGASNTAASPSHSYSAAGTYGVSLTVIGPGGTNTLTKSSYITVSTPAPTPTPAPVASFAIDKTSGTAPLSVAFTSTSTGSITAYAWNFGDGTASAAPNPTHSYTVAGTYSVSLTVTGSGGSNTASKIGLVTVSTSSPAMGGLVAAYSFDEGTGSTVNDLSGNGNIGTISAAAWDSNGRFGTALSFNGTNSWVTVSDAPSLDLTNGMTLEAWVYPKALYQWMTIIMKEQTGNDIYYLAANSDRNQPATGTFIASERVLYGGTQLPTFAWTHLAATYDGTMQKLYMNGALVASRAQAGSTQTSPNPLRIGGDSIWGEYFNGLIDEVRIYNRALSPGEIQTDLNSRVGR
jgi:PKD repeat protein